MKKLLTILLAGVSTLAIAQKSPGRVEPPVPPTPAIPAEPVIYSAADAKVQMWMSEDEQNAVIGGDHGYAKQVRFNPASGELFLQYKFKKKNEEFIYEKTVNAANKSEEDRQQIIDDFEMEIELPGRGI